MINDTVASVGTSGACSRAHTLSIPTFGYIHISIRILLFYVIIRLCIPKNIYFPADIICAYIAVLSLCISETSKPRLDEDHGTSWFWYRYKAVFGMCFMIRESFKNPLYFNFHVFIAYLSNCLNFNLMFWRHWVAQIMSLLSWRDDDVTVLHRWWHHWVAQVMASLICTDEHCDQSRSNKCIFFHNKFVALHLISF